MSQLDNYNFLSPTGFKLIINRERFSNLEFFITAVTLPGINTGTADANNNQYRGYLQGDLVFDELTLQIAIDEDMRVYKELFDWMIENRNKNNPLTYDGTLVVLSNHNNPNNSIKLKNLFPTSISSVSFQTQVTDIEYMLLDISFRYDEFYFE